MTSSATRLTPALRPLGLVLVYALGTSLATAADWPAFEPGQWQFDRTMTVGASAPKTISSTRCTDPTADQKRQRESLGKAGCQFTPLQRSGDTYRYSATCRMGRMTSTSDSVLEVKSPRAYTLTVDSVTDGEESHEVLTARRLGDCAR